METGAGGEIETLVAELKRVRRGTGVQAAGLPGIAGAPLRRVCGVLETDPPGVVRDKIVRTLERFIDRLPDGSKHIARTVLGFGAPSHARYTQRLSELAVRADRDMRTMQRRADEVVYLLAELAVTTPVLPAPDEASPWHTTALAVDLILGGEGGEIFEAREIVSHSAELAEIEHAVSVAVERPGTLNRPPAAEELGIEALRGGQLHSPRFVSSTRVAFQLRPTRVLHAGDRHEFFLRFRVPLLLPFYCATPEFPCERFSLNVRFDPARPPSRVWRIDGELSKDAEDPLPDRKTLGVDGGEVGVAFENLRPARSYGIGWQPG